MHTLCGKERRFADVRAPFLQLRLASLLQVTDQLLDSMRGNQHTQGTHVFVLLLAVIFLLLSCLAFAAGISVETILFIAGILVLLLLVFLSGA